MKPPFTVFPCVFAALLALLGAGTNALAQAIPPDWEEGDWSIVVPSAGPGDESAAVQFPGGSKTGTELKVHFEFAPTDAPQFWTFLPNGFFRQHALAAEFLTSYRGLSYWTSGAAPEDGVHQDELTPVLFRVIGVTPDNRLHLQLDYTNNNAVSGDAFDIRMIALLDPPGAVKTSMSVTITITNVSGRDVAPSWQAHRVFREQWIVFAISTMFVADHFTPAPSAWYDLLDPSHDRVGNTTDICYLNDGQSLNGDMPLVSTHDTKFIRGAGTSLALDHGMPHVVIPGFTWFTTLVLKDLSSPVLQAQHFYDPSRNHTARLLSASGLLGDVADLHWSTRYDRGNPDEPENFDGVDGDNVQINVNLDHLIDAWPDGASQTIDLVLSTGDPPEFDIRRDGSQYRLDWNYAKPVESPDLSPGSWTEIPNPSRPYFFTPAATRRFFGLDLQNVCP